MQLLGNPKNPVAARAGCGADEGEEGELGRNGEKAVLHLIIIFLAINPIKIPNSSLVSPRFRDLS